MHGAKQQQQQQMRRYALWFLLGGVLLTVALVGLTYTHLLSTPEGQKIQKSLSAGQSPSAAGDDRAAKKKVVQMSQDDAGKNDVVRKKGSSLRSSWKSKKFVSVPAELTAAADKITVSEATVQLTVDGKEMKVHYRLAKPSEATSQKLDVLLLHGARFSSKTWQELKTLQLVAAMGHRAVALDLPGYGGTTNEKPQNHGEFIEKFIGEMKLQRPVLITPSMSGVYALAFLLKPSADTCSQRVRGFVPIAPAGTSRYSAAEYKLCKVPTMSVYGEKDTSAPVDTLRQMPNSEAFQIEKAGHVCYKDDPEAWHRLLYNFLIAMSTTTAASNP